MLPVSVEDVYAHGLRVIHYDWIINPAKLEARLARADVEVHGSNEWAIAPSRSATGKAMLMSNSHLQWGDIHTYFEVQLTAPGVTSYGAVWVGFPVLRQCFTEYVGWTQTTNNPAESDLYRLVLKDGGYVLDGQVQASSRRTRRSSRSVSADGALREEPLDGAPQRAWTGRRRAQRRRRSRCASPPSIDRSCSSSSGAWAWRRTWPNGRTAMRMQQLPLFNTAYADRDGHIAYVYNATLPVHPTGDYRFWQGVVPGDRSDLISTTIVPYDQVPKVIDPPTGWVQNSNDMPWTSVYPMMLDSTKFAAGLRRAAGHHATRAARHPHPQRPRRQKITFDDVKKWQAVDARRDRRSVRRRDRRDGEGDRAPIARSAPPTCWRNGTARPKSTSDGMLLFYKFMIGGGQRLRSRSAASRCRPTIGVRSTRRAASRIPPRRWRRSTPWPARWRRNTDRSA